MSGGLQRVQEIIRAALGKTNDYDPLTEARDQAQWVGVRWETPFCERATRTSSRDDTKTNLSTASLLTGTLFSSKKYFARVLPGGFEPAVSGLRVRRPGPSRRREHGRAAGIRTQIYGFGDRYVD